MNETQKKEKLLSLVIGDVELTEKNLFYAGFNEDDINYFLSVNLITKGLYKKYLLVQARNINGYLFTALKKEEYSLALKYLEYLIKINSEKNQAIYYFYLYLLSGIIKIPSKYDEILLNLSFKNNLLNDERLDEIKPIINNVLVDNSLAKARKNIIEYQRNVNGERWKLYFLITSQLIFSVSKVKQNLELEIKDYFLNHTYEETIAFIESKGIFYQRKFALSKMALNTLIDITKNGNIPLKNNNQSSTFLEAITNNDYQTVLKYSHFGTMFNAIVLKVNVESEYQKFVLYLQNGQFTKMLEPLRELLKLKKAEELEFLIFGLIKASILEEDFTFYKVILVLTHLKNDTLYLNINHYLDLYEDALKKGSDKLINVYLSLVLKLNDFLNKNDSKDYKLIKERNNLC